VHLFLAGNLVYPRQAIGYLIGEVNGRTFGVSHIHTNITYTGRGTEVHATIADLDPYMGQLLHTFLILMMLILLPIELAWLSFYFAIHIEVLY
jgi:hypothetical protein